MRISIIDYGLGNLRSVRGAVHKVGYEAVITNNVAELEKADKLVLPGVGAFGDGMRNLSDLGLIAPMNRMVMEKKKPLLAICLGFQLLSQGSHEFGFHQGLGWISATVEKIDTGGEKLPVPHVGWNDLFMVKDCILWDGIPEGTLFYYVHSYHVKCMEEGIIIGRCPYGTEFVAAIQQDNLYATQFHPEKSQYFGLMVLKNFIEKA